MVDDQKEQVELNAYSPQMRLKISLHSILDKNTQLISYLRKCIKKGNINERFNLLPKTLRVET